MACVLAASRHSPFHIDLSDAALGLAVGLLALLPFYLIGLMGAADVKVFATLGAWCGFHALPTLWIVASLAAGMHALYLLASAVMAGRRKSATYSLESSPNSDDQLNGPHTPPNAEPKPTIIPVHLYCRRPPGNTVRCVARGVRNRKADAHALEAAR